MISPTSTNTWLQNFLQKLLHAEDKKSWHVQLATTLGGGVSKQQKADLHFCSLFSAYPPPFLWNSWTGLICPINNGAAELRLTMKLICLSKSSKQAILEVMNGGVFKYFQYLVVGFTNKRYFVNTDKNITSTSSTRKFPFQVENIWHLLVNIPEKVWDGAGTRTHIPFL